MKPPSGVRVKVYVAFWLPFTVWEAVLATFVKSQTVSMEPADELVLKFESPLYAATRVLFPEVGKVKDVLPEPVPGPGPNPVVNATVEV